MSTDASFAAYVCEQAGALTPVSSRRMFGEYALYARGKVIAFVCDNTFFLKPTEAGRAILRQPVEGAPYPGAKPYWRIDEGLDDREALSRLVLATAEALPLPKPKAAKKVAKKAARKAAKKAAKKAVGKRSAA